MQNTYRSKSARRISRSRTVTAPLSKKQTRYLERLFEESPTVNNITLNLNRNDANIINVQRLLDIRSMHAQQQNAKNQSSLDDRIIINVCGNRYETQRTTLENYPDTLLGNPKQRKRYYDEIRKEYFFDRHRGCFEAILYYYQSYGRIRRPDYISLDIFLEEVTFFQLGKVALDQIRKDENIKEVKKIRLPKSRIRRCLWATIEYPDYSLTAKIVNILSLIMVLISSITLAVESLPQYADLDNTNCEKIQSTTTTTTTTTTIISSINNSFEQASSEEVYICHVYFTSPFFLIQAICIGFFTIELILRILTTPSLFDFIKNPMNWIDVVAVIPFYVTLGIQLAGRQNEIDTNTYVSVRFLRILRLARVFKFCRVFKGVKSLRALITTIKQSLLDFTIMISILTLLGFLFGAAAYYAENDSNSPAFDSILKATYWGIITITSVGYGDISPITPIGRVISSLCALFGAATIGILVSVLVDRYQRVYARTLFINEEPINFDDYSDDESNDRDSKNSSHSIESRKNSIIEDSNIRIRHDVINESNYATQFSQTSDSQIEEENSMKQFNNQIHCIISYVDNEKQETTRDLIQNINSIVANKQISEDNITLNIICNGNIQESISRDVQFNSQSLINDESDDDEEELIESF